MKKLSKKQMEHTVTQLFKELGNHKMIPVMDLGKIFESAHSVLVAGGDVDKAKAAMKEAIEKYEVRK